MGLGVNDGDADRSDGDVVDVRLAVPGDAAIVEQPNAGPVEQPLQTSADPDLTTPALLPDAGARRLVGSLDEEGPKSAEPLAGALFARIVPPLVLAKCARTRLAGFDQGGGAGSDLEGGTAQARDRPRCRVPDRHGAHREIGGADPAPTGTAQMQLLCGASRADENGIGRGHRRLDLNQRMVEREMRSGSTDW